MRSYEDRRADALKLRRLGQRVEVPDEAEQARLQRSIKDAIEEQKTIASVRPLLEEERLEVIAAGLPHFDADAEAEARRLEVEGEELLAKLGAFLARQEAKNQAWRLVREGRKELRRELPPGVGSDTLDDLRARIKATIAKAWPADREDTWRAFKAAEQSPPGARPSNTDAVRQFAGRAA